MTRRWTVIGLVLILAAAAGITIWAFGTRHGRPGIPYTARMLKRESPSATLPRLAVWT